MILALNTHNRPTAGPPRDIRGYRRHQKHWGIYAAISALVLLVITPVPAFCQMGQAPMSTSDGLVNRAVQGIGNFQNDQFNRMYYGINGADRGLGYRGSYMTLGGYFPALNDDYGGLWAADARSHLSNYGGFFSNIGIVRKQLLNGGSLLGFGLFWDYDGDQNQYADQLIGVPDADPLLFAGGYSYNQVGISGELLTDWGNIRSNGYIPLGSTGESTGKFVSTNILCMQGINAALGGADFELGAYLPGLADWAGMINVGGYTYGNTLYQLDDGNSLVPWFGGVYTRLDMTFSKNWDFSLQYNNDSYFNSTGFARLTYRLGGSRRRNVPDQMEQPMMRNEHIVRARQNAVVATNPITGQPWRVIHVDNTTTSPATGNGSITNPVASLGGTEVPPLVGQNPTAETIATNDHDIIFVHSSSAPYSNNPANSIPPATVLPNTNMFTFQNSNQYLVGEGSPQTIPTRECGDLVVSSTVNPALYPTIIPSATDTGIFIPSTRTGETISGFNIMASTGTGIQSASSIGRNNFNNLMITDGTNGIHIEDGGGASYVINGDVAFNNQSGIGLLNKGLGEISLTNVSFTDISGSAIETHRGIIKADSITISGSGADGIRLVGLTTDPRVELTSSTISDSGRSGILSRSNGTVAITNSQITGSGVAGIHTIPIASGTITASQLEIDGTLASGAPPTSTGILMEGSTAVTAENLNITNAQYGVDVTGNAQFEMTGGSIREIALDGIKLRPVLPVTSNDGSAILTGISMNTIGGNGITTQGFNQLGGSLRVINSGISTVGESGIVGSGIGATTAGSGASILFQNSAILGAVIAGIDVENSNLRVEGGRLIGTGSFGIESTDASTVSVSNSTISSVGTGIIAFADSSLSYTGGAATGEFNNLTANGNSISATGTGIAINGTILTTGTAPAVISSQGIVKANVFGNNISDGGLTLTTTNGIAGTAATATTPALPPNVTGGLISGSGRPQGIQVRTINSGELSRSNNNVTVTESPTGDSTTTAVDYDLNLVVPVPPQAP